MKSIRLTFVVVAAIALLGVGQANTHEPEKTPTPASDPMLGKEPGQVRDDNGLKMKLVWCPPGKFTMGSPEDEKGRPDKQNNMDNFENQVRVTLSKGFWLGRYEVTQSEWRR